MCFNDVDVTKEEVDEIEEGMVEKETRRDAKKKLNALLSKLRSAEFVAEAATPGHMRLLNDVFDKHFDPESSSSYRIGNPAYGFRVISSYKQDLVNSLHQLACSVESNEDAFATLSENVVTAICTAEYKARLVLMSKWATVHDFSDFPLFTRSFYVVLRRNLRMIQRSLLEVSVVVLWFYVNYVPRKSIDRTCGETRTVCSLGMTSSYSRIQSVCRNARIRHVDNRTICTRVEMRDMQRVRTAQFAQWSKCAVDESIRHVCSLILKPCTRFTFGSDLLSTNTIHSHDLQLSSWFSPYVRLRHLHTKEWSPGSPSADMIRAVLAHPALDTDHRRHAGANVSHHSICTHLLTRLTAFHTHKIVHMIFDSFAAFLHLEGQLASTDIPLPPSRQNELEALFGGDTASSASTKKKNPKGKGKATAEHDDDDEFADFIDDDEDEADDDDDATPLTEQQRKLNRENRLKTRKEAAARMDSLSVEVSAALTVLNSAKKVNPLSVQLEFGSVWTRHSHIPDDTLSDLFRGQPTLAFHTFEWSSIIGGSRARSLRNLARIVIYQHAMDSYYRPRLLDDPESAASYLRSHLDTRLAPYIDKAFKSRSIQSRISPSGLVVTPSSNATIWPDQLQYNVDSAKTKYSLDNEIKAARFVDIRARQLTDLQRTVNAMISSHIVSADKFRFNDTRDISLFDDRVVQALHFFVEVRSSSLFSFLSLIHNDIIVYFLISPPIHI